MLLDASAVLAVLDADEPHHADALHARDHLARGGRRLFQTPMLRAETHALLSARLGAHRGRMWLAEPRPFIVRTEPLDEDRGESIVLRHRDKDSSLCDAISFAVMERLRVRHAFTFDRHFRQYGFAVVP